MPKQEHLAFRQKYSGIAKQLTTVIHVYMLIGMDIIGLGDFSISNGEHNTLFSFAVLPFTNKVDLVEKAEVSSGGYMA